ncbi:hypothetical protein [Psychroserpens mesophilus]|uniref:hypothetical protein n=1 Tax=Psychroserpens mesophilus TaxID=325473 RepID=UPI003D64AFBD
MKQKIKLGILFFGITLLLYQCQKVDDSQTTVSNEKATLKISVVHGDDHFAKSHPVIYNKLKKANQDKVLARETQYSNDYDFYFNLDNIQIIEKPNYTQYTIVVESTIENYDLLNYILILYNDGEEYQYLATYPRVETTEGLEINHYSATLERLNGQSLLARGINMSDCADGNEPQLVDVTQTYSCTEITCTSGNHTSEQECFCGQYVNGMYYNCQRAYLDCGWSSVNNWSCTGGGSLNGPGTSTNGSNNNSNDNTIGTVALNDSQNLKDNCRELNKLTSPPAYPVNNTYTMDGNPYNTYGLIPTLDWQLLMQIKN